MQSSDLLKGNASTKLHREGTKIYHAVVPLRSLKVNKKLVQNPGIELVDDCDAVFGIEELEFGVFRELSSFRGDLLANVKVCVGLKETITPSTHFGESNDGSTERVGLSTTETVNVR